MLTIQDHRRDRVGLTYIYPVVSRRAGGISVGVNLNVNNACNWGCVYCQVEGLTRGGPPPIDLECLRRELNDFLDAWESGELLREEVPADARQIMDVAFSGNGEPTSAAEFSEAVALVCGVLKARKFLPQVKLRLITNGSLMHRPAVLRGVELIGEVNGEVWFKVDRVGREATAVVNAIAVVPETAQRNLSACVQAAPTWVQTCWFALDGVAPDAEAEIAYCDFLVTVPGLCGVHLYGLARPSMQPQASRLGRLSIEAMEAFAARIHKKTGLKVVINP